MSLNEKKNERAIPEDPLTEDPDANPAGNDAQMLKDHDRLTTHSGRSGNEKKRAESTHPVADTMNLRPVSFDSSEAAFNRHFEKCEMVLRSFRNAVPATNEYRFDISYERRLARELLSDSVKFRREAQRQGNLPIENLLVDLEAVLGDLTKLPRKATSSDANVIKGRIQESGIIAKLQIQSSIAGSSD